MSDPYAHVRVGDPDPTVDLTAEGMCDGYSPRELTEHGVQFCCTREADHGPWLHLAGNGTTVVAMWSWDLDLETTTVNEQPLWPDDEVLDALEVEVEVEVL